MPAITIAHSRDHADNQLFCHLIRVFLELFDGLPCKEHPSKVKEKGHA
jgi:hypothetical protein